MAVLIDKDDALADFMADPSPSVATAARSLMVAEKILVATVPSEDFYDEDYRAAERALSRAANAQTPEFVQETLRDMFAWTPASTFSR